MAEKKSTLQVVIDATGAKQGAKAAVDAFERMRRAGGNSTDAIKKMSKSMSSSFISAMSSMMKAAKSGWSKFRSMVSDSIDPVIKSFHRLKSAGQSFSRFFGGLGGTVSGLFTGGVLKALTDMGLKMQKFRTTLTVITGDVGAANEELEWLESTVNRVGISFENAAGPYAKFAAAAKDLMPKEEIREVFAAFSEASAALHLNQQEINGVYLALQQMASKGKVSMEELRLQLAERIPGAMQIAAKVMNVSVGELEDMIRKRSLAAEDFLTKFARGIHEKFGAAAETASRTAIGAFNRFKTAVFTTGTAIAEAGLLDALSNAADRMADFLRTNEEGFRRLGASIGEIVRQFTDWVTTLTPQQVEGFINTMVQGFQSVANFFSNISNSGFFKWLSQTPEQAAIIDQVDTVIDKIEGLKGKIDIWRALGFDTENLEKQMSGLYAEHSKLKAKFESTKGGFVFTPKTTDTVVDEMMANAPNVVNEVDYEEQLKIILDKSEQLRDVNYDRNQLMEKQRDLQAEFLDLQAKAYGQGEFEKLSAEERVDAAVRYKGVIMQLNEVTEQLEKAQRGIVKSTDDAIKKVEKLSETFKDYVTSIDDIINMGKEDEKPKVTTTDIKNLWQQAQKSLEEGDFKTLDEQMQKATEGLEELKQHAIDTGSTIDANYVDLLAGLIKNVAEEAGTQLDQYRDQLKMSIDPTYDPEKVMTIGQEIQKVLQDNAKPIQFIGEISMRMKAANTGSTDEEHQDKSGNVIKAEDLFKEKTIHNKIIWTHIEKNKPPRGSDGPATYTNTTTADRAGSKRR